MRTMLNTKFKVFLKALWKAVKPVIIGAIGGGVVAMTDGCSSLEPSDKTQTMGVYALGIPGIAIITHSQQTADNKGEDTNTPVQVNPVSVKAAVK